MVCPRSNVGTSNHSGKEYHIQFNENKLVYDQMKRFLCVYTAPPPLDTVDLGTDEKAVVFGGRVLDKSRLISRAAEKMYFYQTSNACWLQNDEIKTSSFSIKHFFGT